MAAIAAVESCIAAGTSIAGVTSSFASNSYSVKFKLEVENATKWTLEPRGVYRYWGIVNAPQTVVYPGEKEAMSGHKTANCATGVSGIAIWQIYGGETEGKRKEILESKYLLNTE